MIDRLLSLIGLQRIPDKDFKAWTLEGEYWCKQMEMKSLTVKSKGNWITGGTLFEVTEPSEIVIDLEEQARRCGNLIRDIHSSNEEPYTHGGGEI